MKIRNFPAKLVSGILCASVFGLSSFVLSPHVCAQTGYSTNFDTNFSAGETVSDTDNWVTNDEYTGSMYTPPGSGNTARMVGQSDGVQPANGYTSGNDNLAILGGGFNVNGGAVPGQQTVTLTHPTNLSLASPVSFSTDYIVTAPGTINATHDSFGFIFTSGNLVAGAQPPTPLFSINFVPTSMNSGMSDNISITTNGITAAPVKSFTLGSRYQLSVSVNVSALTFSAFITPETNTGSVMGATTSLVTNQPYTGSLTNIGAKWVLASGTKDATSGAYTNGGDNSLYFDNFSIVPEPSTYAIVGLGLGGLVLATMKRRMRAA